jgi:hypothetical protein
MFMARLMHIFASQVVELHIKGEEHERTMAFDLQQRVYVNVDPAHFVPFAPDEIASTPI